MTSNLGGPELAALLEEEPDASGGALLERLGPALAARFPSALLARFQTIPFRPLGGPALEKIVDLKLAKIGARLDEQYKARLDVKPELTSVLAASCLLPETGARNIDHLLNQQLMPAVSKAILAWRLERGGLPKTVTLAHGGEEGLLVDLN